MLKQGKPHCLEARTNSFHWKRILNISAIPESFVFKSQSMLSSEQSQTPSPWKTLGLGFYNL